MSTLETILLRAMNDPKFAELLFNDFDEALAEYSLGDEDIAKFRNMSRVDFDTLMSMSPDERKSFSLAGTNTVGGSGFFQVRDEGG